MARNRLGKQAQAAGVPPAADLPEHSQASSVSGKFQMSPQMADLNGDSESLAKERAIMGQIVKDTAWLRDHFATKLAQFNTPAQTDGTGRKFYNPQCFLRADSQQMPGVYLFEPIGGRAGYGTGSNHRVVAGLWEKLVDHCRDIHNRAYAIYHNFFAGQNRLGLTEAHFKVLEQDIGKLDNDVQKQLQEFFRDMEAFLKRIPVPEGYTNYYLHGFEKPKVDVVLKQLTYNISRITYAMEPYMYAAKQKQDIAKRVQEQQAQAIEEQKGQTPRFPHPVEPGQAEAPQPGMALSQPGSRINLSTQEG